MEAVTKFGQAGSLECVYIYRWSKWKEALHHIHFVSMHLIELYLALRNSGQAAVAPSTCAAG